MPTDAEALAARTLAILERVDTELGPGLSEERLRALEAQHAFRFPPELRALLSRAVPLTHGFTPWVSDDEESVAWRTDAFAWPSVGVLFDVEHNAFWLEPWGARPADTKEALAVARERLQGVPVLVPVFGHRYLPCEPEGAGNPVLSVYQTDVILYGKDLADWAHCEFEKGPIPGDTSSCTTPFWRDVLDGGAALSSQS